MSSVLYAEDDKFNIFRTRYNLKIYYLNNSEIYFCISKEMRSFEFRIRKDSLSEGNRQCRMLFGDI